MLWPLVPTVMAIALPSCLARAYRDPELTAGRSHVRQRGIFVVLVLALTAVGCIGGIRFDIAVAVRNAALLSGLALSSTVIVRPQIAWMLPLFVPMITWLFGLERGGVVRPWAFLMQPTSSVFTSVASIALLGAGCSCL